MAFKISKQEATRLTEIADQIAEERRTLDVAVDEANEQIREINEGVNARIAALNERLEEARGVIEDIHSERQSEFEDKSERWQEGERGQATAEWLDHLASIKDNDLELIEEIAIEDLDITGVEDHVVVLTENLEHEPNY